MLDEDEMAAYEAWKQQKLVSYPDVSVAAYNAEMGIHANAWDEGAKFALAVSTLNATEWQMNAVLRENPFRQQGMRGHTPHADDGLPSPSALTNPDTTEQKEH